MAVILIIQLLLYNSHGDIPTVCFCLYDSKKVSTCSFWYHYLIFLFHFASCYSRNKTVFMDHLFWKLYKTIWNSCAFIFSM